MVDKHILYCKSACYNYSYTLIYSLNVVFLVLLIIMDSGKELIIRFYTALSTLNAARMKECYSPDIIFSDPLFGVLHAVEVCAMWDMLCNRAQDFSFSFQEPEDKGDGYYTCAWQATYRFTKTGRMVINKGKAFMKLEKGLIVEHSDAFSFQKWITQAFGITGFLLGRFSFFQRKVRNSAFSSLQKWMAKGKL